MTSTPKPKKVKPPKIIWRSCGEQHKDREGFVGGFRLTLSYSWLRSTPAGERYEIRFAGDVMGRCPDVDTAKQFCSAHAAQWVEARLAHLAAQKAKEEEDKALGRARTARAAAAAQALRDLGVQVRDSHGLLSLSVEAAEELLAMLQDLQKIEERGHV